MKTELYDVVSVSIATGKVTAFMGANKTFRNADAIEQMAVLRRGVETEFYATVPARSLNIGDDYAPV